MWLSKSVYESLPWYYLAAGLVALGLGFFVDRGPWPEILFAAGFVGLVAGLVLLLKRRDYRASRSRMDFEDVERSRLDR